MSLKSHELIHQLKLIGETLGIPTLPTSTNFVAFVFKSAGEAQTIWSFLEEKDVLVANPKVSPVNWLIRVNAAPEDMLSEFGKILGEKYDKS